MLKREIHKAEKLLTSHLHKIGATETDSDMYPLNLVTDCGPVRICIVKEDKGIAIDCRFDNLDGCIPVPHNQYSGKWNNFFDGNTSADWVVGVMAIRFASLFKSTKGNQ